MPKNHSMMRVEAIIDSPNIPMLEFCGQFSIPITSNSFVLGMINAIEGRNYHALFNKTHKKLSLHLIEQDFHTSLKNIAGSASEPSLLCNEEVSVSYDGMFMGYTDLEQLYIAFKEIKKELNNAQI